MYAYNMQLIYARERSSFFYKYFLDIKRYWKTHYPFETKAYLTSLPIVTLFLLLFTEFLQMQKLRKFSE